MIVGAFNVALPELDICHAAMRWPVARVFAQHTTQDAFSFGSVVFVYIERGNLNGDIQSAFVFRGAFDGFVDVGLGNCLLLTIDGAVGNPDEKRGVQRLDLLGFIK